MQLGGNLTRGGKYLGVLALLSPWIQPGLLPTLLSLVFIFFVNATYFVSIFFFLIVFVSVFTGWLYPLQI